MFCRKCGQELKTGVNFCNKCGTPVIVAKSVQPQQMNQQPKQLQQPQQSYQQSQQVYQPQQSYQSYQQPQQANQPQSYQQPQKKGKGQMIWVIVIVIVAVLFFCGGIGMGIYLYMSQDKSESRMEEEKELELIEEVNNQGDVSDTENASEMKAKEDAEEMLEMEESPVNYPITLEEFASTLNLCSLEGAQYEFSKDISVDCYVSEGLKGVEGCFYYNAADLDMDGMEEIFTFWIQKNPENGNDILLRIYETENKGFGLASEMTVLNGVFGTFADSGTIRFMIKDLSVICVESWQETYLAADGVTIDFAMYTYDGQNIDTYVTEILAGSDFSDTGKLHEDTLQKLESAGLTKTAENIRERDYFSFHTGDSGLEPLAKLWVENQYRRLDSGVIEQEPLAVCHWITAKENEYVLPNSATELLTEKDVAGLDAAALRTARNEIYARYGWVFENEELKQYFNEKSWYMPGMRIDDEDLSEIEKANRDLIQTMEN